MNHSTLLEIAKAAITNLFSDRNVSRSTTKLSLEELSGEIDIMLEALAYDIEHEDIDDSTG